MMDGYVLRFALTDHDISSATLFLSCLEIPMEEDFDLCSLSIDHMLMKHESASLGIHRE